MQRLILKHFFVVTMFQDKPNIATQKLSIK